MIQIKHRVTGAVLRQVDADTLDGAYLRGAYLRGADLLRANLSGAYLRGAYLRGADLLRANLSGANLSGANLLRANLLRANLSGANLSGANLLRANLLRANLSGANLSGANLSGANLRGAGGIIDLGSPNGWTAYAWLRDGWVSVRVGCHEFRLDEARVYWDGKADRREVMAALDYAEAVAEIRGWRAAPPRATTEPEVEL